MFNHHVDQFRDIRDCQLAGHLSNINQHVVLAWRRVLPRELQQYLLARIEIEFAFRRRFQEVS
jgi:hypothetical protein